MYQYFFSFPSLLFLFLFYGQGLLAQTTASAPMPDFPAPSADDVAVVIQLKDYYDLKQDHQQLKAKEDLKSLFGQDYEILYLPQIQALSVMIGRTNLAEINPIYIELKKKYPKSIIRRMSIDQVNKMCSMQN